MLDFPHAVELVAEEVEQHHVIGLELGQGFREPEFVAFENAPIGLGRVKESRGDAGIEVRARPIAGNGFTRCLECVGEQVRYRGLAVRAHDHNRSLAQPRPQVCDERRVYIQADFAGEVGCGTAEDMRKRPGRNGPYCLRPGKPRVHVTPVPRRRYRTAVLI